LWGFLSLNVLLLPAFLFMMSDLLPEAVLTIFDWIPTVALSKTIQMAFSNRAPLGQIAANLTLVLAGAGLALIGVVWKTRRADR
jgi:hypothetical protein